MSILIKGIDMPKDIDELRLIINGMSIAIEPTKAIQIPTPHGRLIDGDELKEKYSDWLEAVPFINNSLADMGRRDVLISVNHDLTYSAPTILEAEEE